MAGMEESEKSFDPTPRKLQKAQEKGEVARSVDLTTAATYGGLLIALLSAGALSTVTLGTQFMILIEQSDRLAPLLFSGAPQPTMAGVLLEATLALLPWFLCPALAAILCLMAQRAIVFAPSKLALKLSRLDPVQNAKNKYGRAGLFEFAKSLSKLLIYAICLTVFLRARLQEMVGAMQASPQMASRLLAQSCIEFLFLVLLIATGIGVLDYLWQYHEHRRKNRMSRKEIMDETKEAEGDPQLKQRRRQKAQDVALNQMMADVPTADVVIVNPQHYAVALSWTRSPGSAPVCVAKGVDEIAHRIRALAFEHGVPVHSDPPTARALHASVDLGTEIPSAHYRAVAAAIRFADAMRARARSW